MVFGDEEKVSGSGDQVIKSRILLRSAEIVNDSSIVKGDILIEGGIIKQISQFIRPADENVKVITCDGKYVIPGGIDIETNFLGKSKNIYSAEDFNAGSTAALWGGTTFFVNTTRTEESAGSLVSEFIQMKEQANSQSCCDYTFNVAIKTFNEETAYQMKQLVNEYKVVSFKISLRDSDSNLHDDDVAYEFFKCCKNLGVLVLVNAENGKIVNKTANYLYEKGITGPEGYSYSCNEEIEAASVARIIAISEETSCPTLFVNVMGPVTSALIARAKNRSSLVYGETLAASLALNGLHYFDQSWPQAAAFVTDPPLTSDIYGAERLMKHLSSGCIDVTGSDHCKFTTSQRKIGLKDFRKIPSGITGVAERMMVVWDQGVNSGIIDVSQFVAITSSNAARLLNIYPQKGALKEGSDADLVVWDPQAVRPVSLEVVDHNIYKNINSHGGPSVVILNGRVVFENSTLYTKPGNGRFQMIEAHNPFLYRHVALKDKIQSQKHKAIKRDLTMIDCVDQIIQEEKTPNISEKVLSTDTHINMGHRPATRCGGRNMQDSTFSLSGAQVDDNKPTRPGIRSQQPPGGVSSYLW